MLETEQLCNEKCCPIALQKHTLSITAWSMEIILKRSNTCDSNPTQDNDCHRDPDLPQSIYNRSVEVKGMRVIDGTGVLCIQDEREVLHCHVACESCPRDWSHMKAAQASRIIDLDLTPGLARKLRLYTTLSRTPSRCCIHTSFHLLGLP